ncbi:MAG TPA: hypothetical protein DHV28_16295 [Ignavibacteriales bacterium]|nr:hypothetical protein [Ignavibacteriales bacterium]
MAEYLFNQKETKESLKVFFKNEKAKLYSFGSSVNQTFEAYILAKVIDKFKNDGFSVLVKNPKVEGKEIFRLKYSTRGAPNKYTYVIVRKRHLSYQIRHQLRISTYSEKKERDFNANICCDISIIKDEDLSYFKSDESIPNDWLISFGEVKHMSAFAELVASFIGLVHELMPSKLKRIRVKKYKKVILPCFLYVSGFLNPTARGIIETIKNRKFDVDIYSIDRPIK